MLSYKDLYGWTMDKIVEKVGRKNNCTFCGVFRRQALDRGALMLGVNKICTGHNADDIAETVVMNILRGDVARLQVLRARFSLIRGDSATIFSYSLQRCTSVITGHDDEADNDDDSEENQHLLPR